MYNKYTVIEKECMIFRAEDKYLSISQKIMQFD